jgi:hypothetical protein
MPYTCDMPYTADGGVRWADRQPECLVIAGFCFYLRLAVRLPAAWQGICALAAAASTSSCTGISARPRLWALPIAGWAG